MNIFDIARLSEWRTLYKATKSSINNGTAPSLTRAILRCDLLTWQLRRHNNAILLAFYNEVCDQAERNMAATNTVSGAHWNAMRQVLKSKGVEVTR